MRSLQEFARARRCWVCSLPDAIVTQVDEGARAGVKPGTILAWLRDELGIAEASRQRVVTHVQRHVVSRSVSNGHHADVTAGQIAESDGLKVRSS